jgi:hypothetical protein
MKLFDYYLNKTENECHVNLLSFLGKTLITLYFSKYQYPILPHVRIILNDGSLFWIAIDIWKYEISLNLLHYEAWNFELWRKLDFYEN